MMGGELCGWEGNRKFDVAPVIHYGLASLKPSKGRCAPRRSTVSIYVFMSPNR